LKIKKTPTHMSDVHLPAISSRPKRNVADKIGTESHVCLKKLVVHHAEKSALDHYDVKLKTDFGPTSPGVHVAPKLGPGFNSGKLTPREINEQKLRDQHRLADSLAYSQQQRKSWVPPPHMGIGSEPSREPIDPNEAFHRRSVVASIATKSLRAPQLPLSARPSVADLLSGEAAVAPPKALTARATKAPLPAAGFSFPRPSSALKSAAAEAAAEDCWGSNSNEAPPSILIDAKSPRSPRRSSVYQSREHNNNQGPKVPLKLNLNGTNRLGGPGSANEPLSPSAASVVSGGGRSLSGGGGEAPSPPKVADLLQLQLPPLFPTNARPSRKRGALKATVRTKDSDGQEAFLPPVDPEASQRRRGSNAVMLAPIALEQGVAKAAGATPRTRSLAATPSEAPAFATTRAFGDGALLMP
jgi:hypothetical protein